jgi:hypothetical protein
MSQSETTRSMSPVRDLDWTVTQRAVIRAECDYILSHSTFKSSKRCVVLLRNLIEQALEGDHEAVKERTLGISVFGREANYDTNSDPIVRMTANEIRKRLAQYYQSSSRHHEVHISLVPGSYLPRFNFGLSVVPAASASEISVEHDHSADSPAEFPVHGHTETVIAPETSSKPRSRHRTLWLLTIGGLILATLSIVALQWSRWTNAMRSNQYQLWAPLIREPNPVTICVADFTVPSLTGPFAKDWAANLAEAIAGHTMPAGGTNDANMPLTPYVDAEVTTRVAGWLKANGKPFRLARVSQLTLDDFRRGPVVLVGAFDNGWNLALFSGLRYHVQIDPATKEEWIEDSQNPGNRAWNSSGTLLYSDSSVDYATITRVFDKDTRTWFIAAGGLGLHATEAAGDLLTDPELSRSLPEAVRSGDRNVQIVLKTTVIGGHTGAPQILAVYTW